VTLRGNLWSGYAQGLAAAMESNWDTNYWLKLKSQFDNSVSNFPSDLVLVHPSWYTDIIYKTVDSVARSCPIRGEHFNFPIPSNTECASDAYWGYACPFSQSETLHRDHIFPYSLGGPSVPSNCKFLCKLHNSWKGHDFHMLDSDEQPDWLDQVLAHIATYLR
jgi:hypothetical protein